MHGEDVRGKGRAVRVGAVQVLNSPRKIGESLALVQRAAACGAEIVVLPEAFASSQPEPLDGPTIREVQQVARDHQIYVIAPIYEKAEENSYNTAVLIGREGRILGQYRKMFPYWDEANAPAPEKLQVFDLDFGRIAILTCFDINFAELWTEAAELGADLICWPSAYYGGDPLRGYAMVHHYFVVSAGNGRVIDITGEVLPADEVQPGLFISELLLDRIFVHYNFNEEKVARLLRDYDGRVVVESDDNDANWWLLRSEDRSLSLKVLL